MHRPTRIRMAASAVTLALIAAACGSDGSEPDAAPEPVTEAEPEPADEEPDPVDDAEPEPADEEPPTVPDAGGVDPTLERDDVDCTDEGLGADDVTIFTTAHFVVDGALGARCLGDDAPTLVEAWQALASITPPLQLADLGLFGAFESAEEGDEVTLAFVNTLDVDGTLFQMSINLDTYEEDPDEALLTMAHEFSHVFTALPSQVDRTAEAIDSCTTYYNGEGCYTDDSIMWEWIQRFWGDGLIDDVDPETDATGADGQERCDLNPGFFGAYAASTPEEDFAESFSAFVFRVEADSDEQQDKLDWFAAQPGLAEFRDRADAAGLGPLPNQFDPCGEAA